MTNAQTFLSVTYEIVKQADVVSDYVMGYYFLEAQSCINESRENINGGKKIFFSPMSLSSSVIRIVHAMI